MTTQAPQGLADELSQALLSTPYVPSSTQRETFLIDHLVESVEDFEIGEMTYDELKSTFASQELASFDFDSWFQRQVDDDIYEPQ